MPLWPTALMAIFITIWAIPVATARKGVGVAGPDQIFTVTQGGNLSSYVRIYNTGDEPSTYPLNASGNVTQLLALEEQEVDIDPDKSTKVGLLYSVPPLQPPGRYSGTILISVKGPQVSPGVSKNIQITVIKSTPNQAPMVSIVDPAPGRVSGVVEIAIEASDPDETPVDISIMIDGEQVASGSSYLWDTTEVKNGDHVIAAEADDGMDTGYAEVTVSVKNPYNFGPEVWISIPLVLFLFVLILGALMGRSRDRKKGVRHG